MRSSWMLCKPFGGAFALSTGNTIFLILQVLPLENAAGVDADLAIHVRNVGSHSSSLSWNWLPSYGADARLSLRSLRRPATRARRLPRLRAVVSSASTGCREPSVPARVPGP